MPKPLLQYEPSPALWRCAQLQQSWKSRDTETKLNWAARRRREEHKKKDRRRAETPKGKVEEKAKRSQRALRHYAPPLANHAHFYTRFPNHQPDSLSAMEGGRKTDLAQSKCCQEDWLILLRQGVLWSKLMSGLCMLAFPAKGLWVQPPRAICPVMLGHMWPPQPTVWITVTTPCKPTCFCACMCFQEGKKKMLASACNLTFWTSSASPPAFNLLHPKHQHF